MEANKIYICVYMLKYAKCYNVNIFFSIQTLPLEKKEHSKQIRFIKPLQLQQIVRQCTPNSSGLSGIIA